MILNLDSYAIPSSKFTFRENTFVAEASDMGPTFTTRCIYDDACDEGIAIRSERTNIVVIYYLSHTDVKDGDIRYWEFKPISEHERKYPACRGTKVILFND